MKNIIICAVLISLLNWLTGWWWWVLILPIFLGFISGQSWLKSLATGAAASALAWGLPALFIWLSSGRVIASRIAEMMQIPQGWHLIGVAILIAALSGGIGGLTGFGLKSRT